METVDHEQQAATGGDRLATRSGVSQESIAPGCFHCGTPCSGGARAQGQRVFCCAGCLTVYELLQETGLGHFYDLAEKAGTRMEARDGHDRFAYLDEPSVREGLLDFSDGRTARVTFRVPAVHCVACVWLLENLFRLRPGLGRSTVNFPRREVAIQFEETQIRLSEVAALLTSLGYEPALNLGELDREPCTDARRRRLHIKLGLAGFAFGNIMLFSISIYAGLDSFSGPGFKTLFGWLSLALALPVVIYSAADYWRAAWLGLRRRLITIDLPIAVGLAAITAWSVGEVASGRGEGYFDSLTGLIFFLLIGRIFQEKLYDRLSFDRDYRAFFPLSVVRREGGRETTVPISKLGVGDRLLVRQGELVPADARIVDGHGLIDYSFVTGEADAVEKATGDLVHAGGRQTGGAMEVVTVKPVSQSYLTSLWSHEAFAKPREDTLDSTLNQFARRFTITVGLVAVAAAVFWWIQGQPATALKAFVSVLIVACPCALALSAPFALGTAQRRLGRAGIFLKNQHVLESLARVDTVVFDKTGTLTEAGNGEVGFDGAPLEANARAQWRALLRQSTHPYAVRIASTLDTPLTPVVSAVREVPGCGIEGRIEGVAASSSPSSPCEERVGRGPRRGEANENGPPLPGPLLHPMEEREKTRSLMRSRIEGRTLRAGSARWLTSLGVEVPEVSPGAAVHLAVDGFHRGCFRLTNALRPESEHLFRELSQTHEVALLSGDHAHERDRFRILFGSETRLHFSQSPADKLSFIEDLQRQGRRVMMVGDGLNDAGALRQSHVGVAVVEQVGAFSPASDVILEASQVPRVAALLRYSRGAVRVVWLSILLSSLYNAVGLAIAASGRLSPIVCAILMPLSSVSVVAFACAAAEWMARRTGWQRPAGRRDA